MKKEEYLCDWDGEKIRCRNTGTYISFSELGDGAETYIIPTKNSYVFVADNNTVTDETEFKDE